MSAAPLAGATRYRGWPAAGVALAVAAPIGVAAVAAPTVAAAATGGIVLAAIVARAPALFLGFAFVALAYSPEYLDSSLGPLTRPELQKGLIYVGLLAMALVRGVDPRRILPVFAYAVLAVLSYLHGDLAPGLTEQQMASTFVTLTAGWIAIAIRWDWRRDARYLKVLCCIAPLCVALGVLLNAAGLHALWDTPTSFDASYRLRGASIAAQLGLTAFGGSAVAYVAWRLLRWRPAPWLLAANAAILALTVTRGAAIAFAIAAVVPALRFALLPLARRPRIALLRLGAVAIVVVLAGATVIPKLESRNSGGRYYVGTGTIDDPTSGRSSAWSEFYAIAKESPLFGHGLGSGPITRIHQQGFLAQHNEYLRFFLEGGYIGGGVVVLAIVLAIGTCVALAPARSGSSSPAWGSRSRRCRSSTTR